MMKQAELEAIKAEAEAYGFYSDERGRLAGNVLALVAEVERLQNKFFRLESFIGGDPTAMASFRYRLTMAILNHDEWGRSIDHDALFEEVGGP